MNDSSHGLTALTESGAAIGVISVASDLPVSKDYREGPGKLDGKNLRAHLTLRHVKPVPVSWIERFESKSG
jgi:hypothetical protein